MKYKNPILSGFYPDPSICRAGEDFYLVNSSFEYFPGVPVFHSKDLVNWEQIGHCLDRNEQLPLAKKAVNGSGMNSIGIFAPTIRYHQGIFYMVVTNVVQNGAEMGNFYVWAKDPAGPWSDPVPLNTPGIDPSLFFDDDGKVYYIGTGYSNPAIYIRELDLIQQKLVGEPVGVWNGTGGSSPEGPHLYKKNGWYYLLISEGGTERCHMLTMARSREIFGPYEPCPDNPVMTNRSLALAIESVGHGDLVEDQNGNWWAVCLGTRMITYPHKHNLGRETMLVPVDFSGEWPVFGDHGRVLAEFETDRLPEMESRNPWSQKEYFQDTFSSEKLDFGWNFLYNPDWSLYEWGQGCLKLHGNENAFKDAEIMAWIGRRQRHHVSETSVTLTFEALQEGEEAGLSIFLNRMHHYEAALVFTDGVRKLVMKRQIGSMKQAEFEMEYPDSTVTLKLESDPAAYRFYWKRPDGSWALLGEGETAYLTTEVGGMFTGNYIALYSTGNGKKCSACAEFTDYSYSGGN